MLRQVISNNFPQQPGLFLRFDKIRPAPVMSSHPMINFGGGVAPARIVKFVPGRPSTQSRSVHSDARR